MTELQKHLKSINACAEAREWSAKLTATEAAGPVITIGQIRVLTLIQGSMVLTEYRQIYATGRCSTWRSESELERAE